MRRKSVRMTRVSGLPMVRLCIVSAALAGLLTACDIGPGPSPLPRPNTVLLEMHGPGSIPPGGTAQFTLIEHASGDLTRDVTRDAVWRSSNSSVLSISSHGLAAGRQIGDSHLSASLPNGRSTTKEVIVVPAGTYRLTGRVTEADAPTLPIADARVEVTAGPAAGLSTTTTRDGEYRLHGMSGETQVQVAKDGYEPHVQSVAILDHLTQNFQLRFRRPLVDLAGHYTLAIKAAPSCQAVLPEEARTRTYNAIVTQHGPQLEVKLTGASFVALPGGGDGFQGRVEPDAVRFSLREYDFYYQPYPGVAEQIDPSLYLTVGGMVTVTISPKRMAGDLNGSFVIMSSSPLSKPWPDAQCRAEDHLFVLSR
jgi:hypothetical protein